MNRLAKWIVRLYPAAWRARYGDEMDALLADSGADATTVADLLTGGIRMRFSGSFLKLALALGVAGLLLGLGASYLRKPEYVSMATLEMTPVQINGQLPQQDVTKQLSEMLQRDLSRTTLAAIINDPRLDLYSDQRKQKPLEDVIDEMRGNIMILFHSLPGRHAVAFNIRFSYTDKVKAQQTVFALMNAFEEQNQQMQVGELYRLHGYVLEVLDAASLPVSPASPNRYQFAGCGCLLGFLVASAIALVGRGGHSPSAPMLATNE